MSNPYLIQGPAQISFSGGRSSAMMLCKIVEAHGGTLPPDLYVHFANTGKEREETLIFVDRVARHLGVPVRWLEYRDAEEQKDAWGEVDFASAARNSEPFNAVLAMVGYLPTPILRHCSANMKAKPMLGFMRAQGFMPSDYFNVVGFRADEPERVARGRERNDLQMVFPLYAAGVGKHDVVAFWQAMPFDLELQNVSGKTPEGNCDLCHLKGPRTLISLIREQPNRADWWIQAESGGKLFRIDRPNYAALKIIAMQPQLFDDLPAEDAMPCECTD